MLFKLTCCAFSFQGLDLEDKLKLVSYLNFDTVDLSAKQGDELSQDRMIEAPEPYGQAIRKQAAEAGLHLDELFVCIIRDGDADADITSNDPDLQERIVSSFEKFCVFAKSAGFNSISIVPLAKTDLEEQAAWDNTIAMLKSFTDLAESNSLLFNIEPVDFSLLKTPDLACKMVEAVPSLGFTLDYSHYVSAGFSQEEIAKMLPHTRHLHVRQATRGSRQEPVETGTIDFAEVTQRLLDADFSGNLAMEHINPVKPSKYGPINAVVRQTIELAARVKYTAEHEQTKRQH